MAAGRPAPSHDPRDLQVLIPVKSFRHAKVRLAGALPPEARAALARRMGAGVIAAAAPLRVSVVCDDDEVAAWARRLGAEVVWAPGAGLNGAVAAGVEALGRQGARRVVVAHADLPLAVRLDHVGDFEGVTLVPDRSDDGTNVLCIPTGLTFRFSYGARSFPAHQAEAERLGLPTRILRDPRLQWDVDHPADLDLPDGNRLTVSEAETGAETGDEIGDESDLEPDLGARGVPDQPLDPEAPARRDRIRAPGRAPDVTALSGVAPERGSDLRAP